MAPVIGEQDDFEKQYTQKFRALASPYGLFIKYEEDRAAIDIAVHLTEQISNRYKNVSFTRVWIQLKGVRQSTLNLEEFNEEAYVSLDLDIDHLKFWYASPEAVYLIVYIESADVFLAEDIHDIVDRQWGEQILNPGTFRLDQQKARIKVASKSLLNDFVWRSMLRHRSIRIDGPTFRGRPLGHRLDPLRCIPSRIEPQVFDNMVSRLLEVHGFKSLEALDAKCLFPNLETSGNIVSLSTGVLRYTYEWVPQIFNEFGYSPGEDFRIEGEIFHVQGNCAVIIHSNGHLTPDRDALKKFAHELIDKKIGRLLVFSNDGDEGYFGSYFGVVRDTGLACMPQLLGDIAFNLLTATTVYLEFRDKITWRIINYLY